MLRVHVLTFPRALAIERSFVRLFQGYNISLFAYGQTGSGKSHSMMGTEKNPGLIRSVGDFIFDFLDRAARCTVGFDVRGSVTISCIEIYNEAIRVRISRAAQGWSLAAAGIS